MTENKTSITKGWGFRRGIGTAISFLILALALISNSYILVGLSIAFFIGWILFVRYTTDKIHSSGKTTE